MASRYRSGERRTSSLWRSRSSPDWPRADRGTSVMAVRSLSQSGDLLRRAFEYSSGRIIALTRMVLATIFFLALWLDPDQPRRATAFGYTLLLSYLLLAAG